MLKRLSPVCIVLLAACGVTDSEPRAVASNASDERQVFDAGADEDRSSVDADDAPAGVGLLTLGLVTGSLARIGERGWWIA